MQQVLEDVAADHPEIKDVAEYLDENLPSEEPLEIAIAVSPRVGKIERFSGLLVATNHRLIYCTKPGFKVQSWNYMHVDLVQMTRSGLIIQVPSGAFTFNVKRDTVGKMITGLDALINKAKLKYL